MFKITLDPGHTKGVNKGAAAGYYEGTAMFSLANHLADSLREYKDVEVYITRELDTDPSLEQRGAVAINSDSEVFISLHSNASSSAPNAKYVVGFYSVKRPDSKELCDKLSETITQVMKPVEAWKNNSRTKTLPNDSTRDYYGVMRNSVLEADKVAYSYIFEHGFHSNKTQCEWLNVDENLKKLAVAEAKVLAEYFDLKKNNSSEPPIPNPLEREELPDKTDLNKIVTSGKYYFDKNTSTNGVKGCEPYAYILDIEVGKRSGEDMVLQRIYYWTLGIEQKRSFVVKNNILATLVTDWH